MSRAWMPMYWGDYLADTGHFTNAQHGSYLLLIGFYWTNGKLPEDEEAIRRIAKCSVYEWKKNRATLFEKFLPGWKHARIEAELAKSLEKSRVNSANAKRRHSERKADAERSDTHSQSPSQIDKDYSLSVSREAGEDLSIPPELLRSPKQGAKSKCGRFVYFKRGTSEFDDYSRDYREGTGDEPQATSDGRWFKILGENVTQLRRG